jgi:carbamoyl-phosphate synthase large subunit
VENIFVGVSGINAVDNPGPGIGVARSLKEASDLKVQIVGLAYDAMEPGIYMDWVVDKSYLLPYPSSSGEGYLERLLYIKGAHGLDAVLPNLDAELPFYIKYAGQLAEQGIRTFLPTPTQFRLRGKDRLCELGEKLGISVPKTEAVSSHEALVEAVKKIGLPVMVKGCYYKAYRAYNIAEATVHYNELVAEWGYPVIVQEVVSGDELNVVGVGDGQGNSLGLAGIKKIWITSLGKIWTGVTIKHPRMLATAERFVKECNWRGPFELECMIAEDKIYLIEINPRFPAWVYAATGAGMNLPAQLLRRALDLPLPPPGECAAGKLMVRYSYDLITEMTPFHNIAARGEHP